jgi:hypothetical protein
VLIVVVVASVIMVVIIPVAIGAPTAPVFIPPTVRVRPAILSRFMQLLAGVSGLPALPSVMFGGFVQTMVRLGDTPLACSFITANHRCTQKNESTGQSRRRKPRTYPQRTCTAILHFHSALLNNGRTRLNCTSFCLIKGWKEPQL